MVSKRETHILLIGDPAEHERLLQLLAQPRGEMRFRLEQHAEGAALAADATRPDVYLIAEERAEAWIGLGGPKLDAPSILLGDQPDEDLPGRLRRLGASDYLPRNELSAALLQRTLRYALEQQQAQHEHARLELVQQQLTFLSEASAALGATLDYETTLLLVTRLAVPILGDLCLIELFEQTGELQRKAICHKDTATETRLAALPRAFAKERAGGLPQQRRPWLITQVGQADLEMLAGSPRQLETLAALELRSAMIVPLVRHEQPAGVLLFGRSEESQPYAQSDLALAEEFSRHALLALENARLYREAQEALLMRDQFIAVAAHELKTPVTSLLGYAQLLRRRAERDEQGGERNLRAFVVLSDQARKLQRLVSALLDLSRIQSGQLELDRELLDLPPLLRRLTDELRPSLHRHTLELVSPHDALIVEGDEIRLEQVFRNLIQNAVKYTPQGGPIVITLERKEQMLAISIADQGVGIPGEALPRIFSRFYRAGNVSGLQFSGMGLGLFVVKELITLHGGSVEVRSAEGQGSTFTVLLPLHEITQIFSELAGQPRASQQ